MDGFYRAVGTGDIPKARSLLSKQFEQLFGEKKLTAILEAETGRIKACEGIEDIITTLGGEGDTRTGTAMVSYKGDLGGMATNSRCKPRTEKVSLSLEDRVWKIVPSK